MKIRMINMQRLLLPSSPSFNGISFSSVTELVGSSCFLSGYFAFICENVLNERLVELKHESYQKIYYIDKAVTRITIK